MTIPTFAPGETLPASKLNALAALPASTVGEHIADADPHGDRAYTDAEITALGLGTASTAALDTDSTMAANSDTRVASQKATKAADAQILVDAKTYADALVMGLLDDRGSYDASGDLWPDGSTATGNLGGSGAAHAIMKGDVWTLSVAGTLGGTSYPVGTLIRALTDSPGQTAGNWAVAAVPFGFSPENQANKTTGIGSDPTNTTKYPHFKAVYDWVTGAFQPLNTLLTAIAALSGSGWLKFTSGTPSVAAIAVADLPANITTYDMAFGYSGKPGADQNFNAFCVVTPTVLPAGLTGSRGAPVVANPTSNYVVSIKVNGSEIGTVTYTGGGSSVSFALASDVTLAVGDTILPVGQSATDATLDYPIFTLKGRVV